ncbi:hypothetical protein FFK22_010075 [Mycobacterium sp. KBS0706]|uniref:hypothetical protein n=1 Tax=Mycobacterium sp. KBS0706 TaxID=2578109 RepID=UPI00110FA7DD|nr:hypothetical protein [Mycobacterium sp. KBS0706]TSD88833.1 hypothetical protein FFK22_010075 [Mycobacterium sp. KBS0706]
MEPASEDLDIHAHCRSLALQQIGVLTRLAEIGMQLAEAEGANALAAQARVAEARAEDAAADATGARAEARQAGLAFSRFARSVQHSLALRSRAADHLCARAKDHVAVQEAARKARRARHRDEVEFTLGLMINDEVEDLDRVAELEAELEERVADLYQDEDVRVEDRPVGSVMAGLASGLGLTEEWRRWAPGWPATPRPARPAGSEAKIRAERARRRDIVVAVVERAFADVPDPSRIPGLRAGLAVRLQEPDVIEWLDTECAAIVADRLCRSLGIGMYFDDPEAADDLEAADTG